MNRRRRGREGGRRTEGQEGGTCKVYGWGCVLYSELLYFLFESLALCLCQLVLEDSLSLGFLSTHTERFLLLQFLTGGGRRRGRRGEGRVKKFCSATHRSTSSCTPFLPLPLLPLPPPPSLHLQGPVPVSCVDNRDCLGVNHPDVCSLGLGITLRALPCTLTFQPLVNTAGEEEEESTEVSSTKKGLANTVQFLIAHSAVGMLRNKVTFWLDSQLSLL